MTERRHALPSLTHFLYLLIRDEMPTGRIAAAIQEAEQIDPYDPPRYSAQGIRAQAHAYAERLLAPRSRPPLDEDHTPEDR